MTNELEKIEKVTLKLLRAKLGKFVDRVTIREDVDYDDESALFIDAYLDHTAPSDLGKQFIFSHLYLREKLQEIGENRFPYLTTRRPDTDQRPMDMILNPRTESGSRAKRRVA